MPNEFAQMGYVSWLRTWVDDERYVSPFEDGIDLYPILIDKMPDYAFDSTDERGRVQALLDSYNNPSKTPPEPDEENDEPPSSPPELSSLESSSPEPSAHEPSVKMTREIDAEFGRIAHERITRDYFRYYVSLPLKRARSIWFDTHSQYYPFQGELFPFSDLDTDVHQQYWLPLFASLTWFYTIVALTGAWVMWSSGSSRRWVMLLALFILPRLAFLAFQEHPETRYTVEFFPLIAAAGSLALANLTLDQICRGKAIIRSKARSRGSNV
jgi:hypothetical protein